MAHLVLLLHTTQQVLKKKFTYVIKFHNYLENGHLTCIREKIKIKREECSIQVQIL